MTRAGGSMRRRLPALWALVLLLAGAGHAAGHAAVPVARVETPLDAGWQFLRGDRLEDGVAPADVARAGGDWQAVDLPHSFNAHDATEAAPYRGAGWYRRRLAAGDAPGRRTYLEFDGAALVTDVWLDGVHLGRHEGGFARFRFDVTGLLRGGAAELVVRVDNARHPDVAPLAGDYTLYGGLYRSVRLVSTPDVHVDMLDYGSPGVRFRADGIAATGARLHWVTRVTNDRRRPARVTVKAILRDHAGRPAAVAAHTVTVGAGAVLPVALEAALPAPHRWQGVDDPYLYRSQVSVTASGAGAARDEVAFDVGIRDVRIDPARGLLLNGRPVRVHGVNLHLTSTPAQGVAVRDADVDADYAILDDLGVTGLRFAHYQHGQRSYAQADRKGFLVWTELPLTSEVSDTPAFARNLAQQARELVRQNIHHPSVFVWGLGNEIYKVDAASGRILDAMQRLVREDDPDRPTAYANCCAPIDGPQASHTDLVGSNVYFGWYDKAFDDLGPWLADNRARRPGTPQAVSEYGAGASVLQQEDPPRRPVAASHWHPEQYQALYHEAAWRQIRSAPWLWASFVWTGFDFASAGRDEGDRRGINDKGLVTFDRTVRKDAYYWYRANWSSRPTVYIASRRDVRRTVADVEVKVYSNRAGVALRVNGTDLGTRSVDDHVARWNVRLAPGRNRIEALAADATDAVEWEYAPPDPLDARARPAGR